MWVITKNGFISIVQHQDDKFMMRVRARRRDHLVETFDCDPDDVIDLGESAPDYRYHVNISRDDVAEAMAWHVEDINYTSHVKEAVAGDDAELYTAMLSCWRALHLLQGPIVAPSRPSYENISFDDELESYDDVDDDDDPLFWPETSDD